MQPAQPTLVIELVEATEPVIPLETRDSMSAGDDRPVIPGHSKVDFGKSQRKRSRRNEEFDGTSSGGGDKEKEESTSTVASGL